MPESSPLLRGAIATLLSFRVAYGLALMVVPAKVAGNRWLGEGAARAAADVPIRGLGAREVALHGTALWALAKDSDVRPWLLASVLGDLADIGATVRAREGLPKGSAPATAAVAGVSAALSGALALSARRPT